MPLVYLLCNLVGGAAITFAFAPLAWYPLVFLSLALVLFAWCRVKPRTALYQGYLFGYLYALGSVYWVYYSLHDYGNASPWFAGLAVLLFAAFLALYYAVLAWLIAYLRQRLRDWQVYLLIFPSLWVILEWLRSFSSVGFPWNLAGQALVDSPLATVLPVVGAYGAGFIAALCAGVIVCLACCNLRVKLTGAVTASVVVLSIVLLGKLDWTEPVSQPVSYAVVQPNINQTIKFDISKLAGIIDMYRTETVQNLDRDLIVWPETALPPYADQIEKPVFSPLRRSLIKSDSDLLAGVFHRGADKRHNSLMNVRDNSFYHKRRLVPLGEYIPLRGLLQVFSSLVVIPMSDLHSGNTPPLTTIGQHQVGLSICYESAFGDDMRDALPNAHYLVNVSDDSWFGYSNAPFQLLQITRLRAAETGRNLLRATSTGISALIDWTGKVFHKTELFERQTLLGEIQPRKGLTPYARFGNTPILGTALLLIVFGLSNYNRRDSWLTNKN